MKFGALAAFAFLVAPSAPSTAQGPSFCERLAPQLGMVPIERGGQGRTTGEWRVNTLPGVKNALFGGSTLVSLDLRPVSEDASAAEYARLRKACEPSANAYVCQIEGPAIVIVSTGKAKGELAAQPSERAELAMKGRHLICRDPRAMPSQ